MGAALEALGLGKHIPSEPWPPMGAVRELNTKIKNLVKAGFTNAFVDSDLKKFLPPFYADHVPVLLETDGSTGVDGEELAKQPKSKRPLDLASWQVAWDRFGNSSCVLKLCVSGFSVRYMLAAVVLKQFSFVDGLRHKAVVVEIAATAVKEGGSPMLAVMYDKVARSLFSFPPRCQWGEKPKEPT